MPHLVSQMLTDATALVGVYESVNLSDLNMLHVGRAFKRALIQLNSNSRIQLTRNELYLVDAIHKFKLNPVTDTVGFGSKPFQTFTYTISPTIPTYLRIIPNPSLKQFTKALDDVYTVECGANYIQIIDWYYNCYELIVYDIVFDVQNVTPQTNLDISDNEAQYLTYLTAMYLCPFYQITCPKSIMDSVVELRNNLYGKSNIGKVNRLL